MPLLAPAQPALPIDTAFHLVADTAITLVTSVRLVLAGMRRGCRSRWEGRLRSRLRSRLGRRRWRGSAFVWTLRDARGVARHGPRLLENTDRPLLFPEQALACFRAVGVEVGPHPRTTLAVILARSATVLSRTR